MATLTDFFQAEQPGPFFGLSEIGQERSRATSEAGVQLGRNQRQFQTRTLPDLVSRGASRGIFHSGILEGQAGEVEEDFLNRQADIQRELSNVLAGLTRQRLFTMLGV